MADLTTSQNQKKLSGLCYENTVIDRKGRIRKIKPPVAIKLHVPKQPPNLEADNLGDRREAKHPNGSFNTEANLNTRNILEVNANETKNFQPETTNTQEVLENRIECSEPVWKERPGAKRALNPEHCRQGLVTTRQDINREKQEVVTTGQGITCDRQGAVTTGQDTVCDKRGIVTTGQGIIRDKQGVVTTGQDTVCDKQGIVTTRQDIIRDKQGVVTTGQDIIRDVDNYKEVLLKSAQLRFTVQKIQKQKIDRIEDGVVAVGATNEEAPQNKELIRDVYELALENLDEDDDDDDDDEDDEDEGGSGRSLRSESLDTLVERILESIAEDGTAVDFDGDSIPQKPPRGKLYSKEKSFSDEILERFGETPQKSPDVALTTRNYDTDERIRSSMECNGACDGSTARVQISEQQYAEQVRRHSELSSAAAAAIIRLDRYIIDQQPRIDAEPQISYAEPKVSDAKSKTNHAEPIDPPPASFLFATAALSSDVVSQPTDVNVPVSSNLPLVALQPSVPTIQLADSQLVRERSPEEVFEEIVEGMQDTEGEYEDPFFLDWPALFPAPGKSPEGELRTDCAPIDYSVENDWLSFFYCNRVNVVGDAACATAPQRRSSLGNSAQAVPNSMSSTTDSVGMFMNTSLSSSSSWMARPARGTFPHSNLSKKPTSRRSEERGDTSPAPKQPEQVPLKSMEPVDALIQSRGRTSSSSSRSEEQTDVTFQSNSGPSRSISQNQPDLLPRPVFNRRASDGQHSKEDHLNFPSADQSSNQNCPEVEEPHSVDVPQSVVQAAAFQNLDTDSQPRQETGEKVKELDTETKSLPATNPERISLTAVEFSPELSAEPKFFPSDNPEEVSVMAHSQIDYQSDENPTALLFAALDDAFAQNIARTEAESLKENDADSDTDNTLTPKEDICHEVFLQSHRDASLNKQFFSLEPYDIVNDTSEPENHKYEVGKVNGPRLQESSGLRQSLEESKQQENQTGKTSNYVGETAEEKKRLTTQEFVEPPRKTELCAISNRNGDDTPRKRKEWSADIGVDIPKICEVSEAEKIVTAETTSNDDMVAETNDQQTVANRDSIGPVTVRQPQPPKRVVKVLSDEVTTQTVLLKIAWPTAKRRERSRERIEQPFRELQLRRTIRMTDPGNNAPQIGRQITPSVTLPSTKNHSHTTSASGETLNDKTVESPNNNIAISNSIANSNGVVTSNDVINNNETQSISLAESQPPAPSSLTTRPEFVVEYENQESSHNTEVTQDATVDVTQTDSVKVLLVPVETVYKVQDLKEIVAAVGKTILNDSRRIPVESNVRVTCEAVQSKSCAAVQDHDVTIIRNTILDTYNSTNALPVKASAE